MTEESVVVEYHATKERLFLLLSQEELYWRQRAKSYWMRDGDRNTKYFHASASTKKRRNKILRLRGEGNEFISDQDGMYAIA